MLLITIKETDYSIDLCKILKTTINVSALTADFNSCYFIPKNSLHFAILITQIV